MLRRDERLNAELERMELLSARSEFVSFVPAGNPPDRYTVYFTCAGLVQEDNQLTVVHNHRVFIYLHADYPRLQPRISWITPIFHPNVKDRDVCLGRSWSPAMMLDDLCLELGAIIQYKTFNLDDPLNGYAAQQIRILQNEHPEQFPIDKRNLLGPLVDVQLTEEKE